MDGHVLFVAHDTLGARPAHRVCRCLEFPVGLTDLAVTLTTLHLRIGFMDNPRSDYTPERLARAAGPFGEKLGILCWADGFAAQGPRLKPQHIERHRELCIKFLRESRDRSLYSALGYEDLAGRLGHPPDADVGYTASRVRLLQARGLAEDAGTRHGVRLLGCEA
jgi:poly(A) polymerase